MMANMMTSKVFVAVLGLCSMATMAVPSQALEVTATTAIPVIFTHALKAGKDKPEEAIAAKTLQSVVLPGGQRLPKGSILKGRIVESRAFVFDPTPYAVQKPSVLSLRFDNALVGSQSIPLHLVVRAMADAQNTSAALTVRYYDESDFVGTKTLAGGDVFSPREDKVRSANDDIVAYIRKDGVFAHLLPNSYQNSNGTVRCDGGSTEQSVAVFSPDACGLYGFDATQLSENGKESQGVITLESTHNSVWIGNGSSALLQLID
jgi:hypothetical protein